MKQFYHVKGEFLKAKFYDHVAAGLVSVFTTRDTDIHKRQRRLLSAEMAESSINRYLPIVDARVRLAIQRMDDEMRHRHATVSVLFCPHRHHD
jgi:cytochrome P450